MNDIKVSVITCTWNRSKGIVRCLDSIAQSLSEAAPVTGEIILVDNASTDDTSAIVSGWAKTSPFPVRLIYEGKKGVSAARNTAMRAAQGELLVFTDDDCSLTKTHIKDALRYDAADTGPVLRGGRVELGDETDLPLTTKTSPNRERLHRFENPGGLGEISMIIIGCNVAVRRSLALKIGPFDEFMGAGTNIPAAEDTDISLRAYLADVVLEYVPDMTVKHYHGRKDPATGKKLMANYFIGNGAIYAKYLFKQPLLCRQLYWDLRNVPKEIITGKNLLMPEVGFGYRDWVKYCLLGMFRYWRKVIA